MNVPQEFPKAGGISYRIKACDACRHRKARPLPRARLVTLLDARADQMRQIQSLLQLLRLKPSLPYAGGGTPCSTKASPRRFFRAMVRIFRYMTAFPALTISEGKSNSTGSIPDCGGLSMSSNLMPKIVAQSIHQVRSKCHQTTHSTEATLPLRFIQGRLIKSWEMQSMTPSI